jgi:hypothetical protein
MTSEGHFKLALESLVAANNTPADDIALVNAHLWNTVRSLLYADSEARRERVAELEAERAGRSWVLPAAKTIRKRGTKNPV